MEIIAIRKSADVEIDQINSLLPRQEGAVLEWMLRGADAGHGLHSFVALMDDRIVGHVGYTLSRFRLRDREATGVHVVNWVVGDEYRGRKIGARLFEATFDEGDFSYHFSGTPAAERVYPTIGFTQTVAVSRMFKVLNPVLYYRSLEGSRARNAVKALVFGARSNVNRGWLTGRRPDVRLEPYGPEGHRAQHRTDCIVNVESPEKIAWLTRCPVMESAAFNVRVDGSIRGIAVCYIKTAATGIGTGRIAHLSFLGEDPSVWHATLRALERYLRRRRCATISTYACHPRFIAGLARHSDT